MEEDNRMIRLAIVDDEQIYVKEIKNYIRRYENETGEKFSVVCFQDGDQIAENYTGQYDIILMDIQMQFMDGLEAAKKIREFDSEVVIMFVTNMKNYAIRGYEVDALDYLVKPVDYYMFSRKMDKALKRIGKRNEPVINVRILSGVMRFKTKDIYYVESDGHNLSYFTSKGTYRRRSKIKDVEDELVPYGFFRTNKSYLVNMQYVDGIDNGACLVHGEKLLISRSKKKEFMAAMLDYMDGINC